MKATEQYFPVVLFIVLYKVVLTFELVNEIKPFKGTILGCCLLCFARWFLLIESVDGILKITRQSHENSIEQHSLASTF